MDGLEVLEPQNPVGSEAELYTPTEQFYFEGVDAGGPGGVVLRCTWG